MLKIGKFNIDAVDTGVFGLDGGSMFGVVPKNLWSKAYNAGDEQNRIPLSARPLLVRFDDRIALIDTGNGNKFSAKLVSIYNIDTEKSNLEYSLKPFGITPGDITDVILTHLHFDHAGGATVLDSDGKAVPTFPNAQYYVQQEQYRWAMNPTEKDRGSFFRDDFEPIIGERMVEFTEGEGEIFKGISVIPINGHTKMMQMIKISDADQTLLFMADLAPTKAHIAVPFGMGYDNYPLTTIEEKKKYFPQAYEEGWIIAFEHDAFTQAAKLAMTPKGLAMGEEIVITEKQ